MVVLGTHSLPFVLVAAPRLGGKSQGATFPVNFKGTCESDLVLHILTWGLCSLRGSV